MNFQFSPEDEAFRQEVRAFLRENIPADLARNSYLTGYCPERHDIRRMQKLLHDKGWGAPHWPKEWGGTDWTPLRKHIFMEELYNNGGVDAGWQALHMVAPVLIAFGSEEQKKRFLPPMLSGDEFWAQGFSEPNAGSDLANLKTHAVLDGDEWVINGQKIWTSDASMAEWGFFLVRTDSTVKPQRGISFLLVKMDTPGLTIRPIQSIDGGKSLHEVFLENVRVPKENLVGEAGMGWTYAKYLLEKERTTSAFIYFNKLELARAKHIARQERVGGVRLIDTPEFARKLASAEVDVQALEYSVLRILCEEKSRANADAVVSALKIRGSLTQQKVTGLSVEALGLRGLRQWDGNEGAILGAHQQTQWPEHTPGRVACMLFMRASTIYGGSLQVQKNIIAKLAFGL